MQTPQSNAFAAERRLSQAKRIALLLSQRQLQISGPFMSGLTRSMSRGLLAFGFTSDFVDEEAVSLRALVEQEMQSLAAGR